MASVVPGCGDDSGGGSGGGGDAYGQPGCVYGESPCSMPTAHAAFPLEGGGDDAYRLPGCQCLSRRAASE